MRGKVRPGVRNLTDGRGWIGHKACPRRGIRSAVRRSERGFGSSGRHRSGFGCTVQGGGKIGKVRTDQLNREATNDSNQCQYRHDRYW